MILVLHDTDDNEVIVNVAQVFSVTKSTMTVARNECNQVLLETVECAHVQSGCGKWLMVRETRAVILEMLAIGRSLMVDGPMMPIVYAPQDSTKSP